MSRGTVTVVGSGAFGASAALELSKRDYDVLLLERGSAPDPAASSTDISKAVRMDYGCDTFYVELAEEAIRAWHACNDRWRRPVYREVGILMLAGSPFDEGGFEADSFATLTDRGIPLERLRESEIGRRFPAWHPSAFVEAYYNPRAGWAASGEAVRLMLGEARSAGAVIRDHAPVERLGDAGSPEVVLDSGEVIRSDLVVVAAGAWTPALLPELADRMWAVGQPVVFFRPDDSRVFDGERFPVWCADIARTGRYGFPINEDGLLKVGHHGPGRRWSAGEPLAITSAELDGCRGFLRETFRVEPGVDSSRLCLYCDTFDGNFFIDHVPARDGVVVAAGGSGHGFKYAPVAGPLIADVVEGRENRRAERFAWRAAGDRRWEQARQHEGG